VEALLHPRAIAVVGASSDPTTISGLLFGNLLDSHFSGAVLPVNSKHSTVRGVAAYPELAACPVVPDLVVVCVPSTAAPGVVAQAGDLGVRAVCVVSAGFAETGEQGTVLQADLVREAFTRGVRLVGPNCAGILAGTADARFNATFSRVVPRSGRTSLVTQSGAIGLAVLEAAEARGLGIGNFVSVGNSPDDIVNDLLLRWGQEGETDLILLYLESIQDPKWFARIARQVSTQIPIVVVKSGRSQAGRRGAASHTAALAAGDVATEAFLRQAGVIRAQSIEEMLDLACVMSSRRSFAGSRVAIVTNGGGPGVLAADACELNGLEVPTLNGSTTERLRTMLTPEASVANPVDMIASATAQHYGQVARVLGTASEVDTVMVMFNTPLITRAADVAAELIGADSELGGAVSLLGVFMNRDGPPRCLQEAGIATFRYPENAAKALGRCIAWRRRRTSAAPNVVGPSVDADAVAQLMAQARCRAHDGWLGAGDVEALLRAYGIAQARAVLVRTPQDAQDAQAELGCTVAVKLTAPIHKSDVGGVRLGISTPAQAADAVEELRETLESRQMSWAASEFLVQEQISSGQEMIVGVKRDQLLGPVVMVGLGGKLVEVLSDVAFGMAPLSNEDVDELLRSLKSYCLLTGFRGAGALDVEALTQVVQRASVLAHDLDEVVEMDLNPVFVLDKDALVVDARIRLQTAGMSVA